MIITSEADIDVYIGKKLRYMRELRGLSQETLGKKLGIAFQQIQKYEKGVNRISASRLYLASCSLCTSYETFVRGLPDPENIEPNNININCNNIFQEKKYDINSLSINKYEKKLHKEVNKLISAYRRIKQEEDRAFLLKMAQNMMKYNY